MALTHLDIHGSVETVKGSGFVTKSHTEPRLMQVLVIMANSITVVLFCSPPPPFSGAPDKSGQNCQVV